jgi:hypothetical protein
VKFFFISVCGRSTIHREGNAVDKGGFVRGQKQGRVGYIVYGGKAAQGHFANTFSTLDRVFQKLPGQRRIRSAAVKAVAAYIVLAVTDGNCFGQKGYRALGNSVGFCGVTVAY